MEQFAGYGFNKSHSAAYALVAYQTAYLKAHYPVEFMAALLTEDMGNTDKVIKNIADCREMGIEVLPPDINASDRSFRVLGNSIRFGLGAVKNVGEGAIEAIIEARKEGDFKDIFDFCERVDLRRVNKRVVESLIKCGAFDSLDHGRRALFDIHAEHIDSVLSIKKHEAAGQFSLFGGLGGGDGDAGGEALEIPTPAIGTQEWDKAQLLAFRLAQLKERI